MGHRICLVAVFSCAVTVTVTVTAQAQSPRTTVENRHAWLVYLGDHALAPKSKSSLHLETQVRRGDLGADWQQLLLRGGLTRTLSTGVRATGGYAFVRTYRYGEAPVRAAFPEHRLWQQLSLAHRAGPVSVTHRYRLEQRWIGIMSSVDPTQVARWRNSNRFRYMVRGSLPLSGGASRLGHTYLAGSGELFTSFGGNVQLNVFDQSRLGAALGLQVTPTLRVEAGYLQQYILKPSGRDAERNHTVQISLLSAARLPF